MKSLIVCTALALACISVASAEDPGWPRRVDKDGATLIVYQPQVDSWNNFTDLDGRFAISLTPPAGKPVVGVVVVHGQTDTNAEDDMVTIHDLSVKSTEFPSLNAANAAQMDQLTKAILPQTVDISMRRLVACVPKKETGPTVELNNTPPAIFVSNTPAILLFIQGQPQFAMVPGTELQYVVNTSWPLFVDANKTTYYLLAGQHWMTATTIQGPWYPTKKLHRDMDKVKEDPQWVALAAAIPPPKDITTPVPNIFVSFAPAEVILFNGPPSYSAIPGTQLSYVSNSSSEVFLYAPTMQYYYLTAGRWFRAASLQGPWTFATLDLPADFSKIPPNSPAGRVLASVPGTEEAKDAVLMARVPTTLTVNPTTAAAEVKVTYSGEPQFKPIEGTSLSYAVNTADKVIQVGDLYYLCLQGIWFNSTTAQGPWVTAMSVPPAIYTIPPSSPVYNVTYVTQNVLSDGNVQASYTAGYLGAFVTGAALGAIVASGSGYYWPPYVGFGGAYYPFAATWGTSYGTWGGAYGLSQTAYGPYGSANRFAQYNPYTGTYSRGGSVTTPYGSRSFAQAYNPYTGAYGAHASGSSPGAQWGSSVVSRNGNTATAQHLTTASGTRGSIQASNGARAYGSSTAFGNNAVGRSANGDLYAGHDGNVYKNTGGSWQKYNNGSWNNVAKPTSQSFDRASSGLSSARTSQGGFGKDFGGFDSGGMDKEFQDRSRGSSWGQHFSSWKSGGFGDRFGGGGDRFGGGGGFGGGRFGGFRR
jgi:hypothetical protein